MYLLNDSRLERKCLLKEMISPPMFAGDSNASVKLSFKAPSHVRASCPALSRALCSLLPARPQSRHFSSLSFASRDEMHSRQPGRLHFRRQPG